MDGIDALDIGANPYKADFPLFYEHPDLVYLDNAATAQRPSVVIDALAEFYETSNANPLRGVYSLSMAATEAVTESRLHVASYIGASSPAEVVFTRNASEALNLAAISLGDLLLGPSDEVAITIMEHHSNLIPWQQACERSGARLVFLRTNDAGVLDESELEKIGPATKIVSCTQLSNVLGLEVDVAAIARRAHDVGAVMVVDGAQSVPHLHVDVQALGIDLMAFSAHKLGGPMGVGVLWGRSELLERMSPVFTGGEMVDSVSESSFICSPIPEKFEAGTCNAAGIHGTDAALTYLEEQGRDVLEQRERLLSAYLCESLLAIPGVEVLGSQDPSGHLGAVSFNVGSMHPKDVAAVLDAQRIAIRSGQHCAAPLLDWMGVPSCCRASVAFYNDREDIDRLADALRGLG